MELTKNFKNELLKRKEVKILLEHIGSPKNEDVKKMIAQEFKSDENLVVVNTIKGKFGRKTFLIDVFVYNSMDDLNKTEQKPKKKAGAVA